MYISNVMPTWGKIRYQAVLSVSRFSILQATKNWVGPGNEATSHILCVYTSSTMIPRLSQTTTYERQGVWSECFQWLQYQLHASRPLLVILDELSGNHTPGSQCYSPVVQAKYCNSFQLMHMAHEGQAQSIHGFKASNIYGCEREDKYGPNTVVMSCAEPLCALHVLECDSQCAQHCQLRYRAHKCGILQVDWHWGSVQEWETLQGLYIQRRASGWPPLLRSARIIDSSSYQPLSFRQETACIC